MLLKSREKYRGTAVLRTNMSMTLDIDVCEPCFGALASLNNVTVLQ